MDQRRVRKQVAEAAMLRAIMAPAVERSFWVRGALLWPRLDSGSDAMLTDLRSDAPTYTA